MNQRYFAVLGALLAAAGVLLGAYHAHGLESWLVNTGLTPEELSRRMGNAEVAIRYQMYHALALLTLGCLPANNAPRLAFAAGTLLCLGTLLFSGGLYVIVFAGTAIHWAIVPSGGLLLIVAWLVVAAVVAQRNAGG
jgi:uncharacterized membrane protein YgdD (TMEM256/DUF423 family)